jgi:hypothetical protein
MGKQSKLKKIRKETITEPKSDLSQEHRDRDFVKEISKKGYQFAKIIRSPEIPDNHIEPQI